MCIKGFRGNNTPTVSGFTDFLRATAVPDARNSWRGLIMARLKTTNPPLPLLMNRFDHPLFIFVCFKVHSQKQIAISGLFSLSFKEAVVRSGNRFVCGATLRPHNSTPEPLLVLYELHKSRPSEIISNSGPFCFKATAPKTLP